MQANLGCKYSYEGLRFSANVSSLCVLLPFKSLIAPPKKPTSWGMRAFLWTAVLAYRNLASEALRKAVRIPGVFALAELTAEWG